MFVTMLKFMKKQDRKPNILRVLMDRDMLGYEIGKQLVNRGVTAQLSSITYSQR